jgi:hypothetical protein
MGRMKYAIAFALALVIASAVQDTDKGKALGHGDYKGSLLRK